MFLPEPSGHRDVALGLCRTAGRVLLCLETRRIRGVPTPVWDLPGGAARPGEPLRDVVAREWREEVGFRADVGDLLLVVDGAKRSALDAPPRYTWREFVFHVAEPAFGVMPVPGPGIEKIDLVKESDAPLRLSAPYHGPLRAYLRDGGARYGTVSWIEPPAPGAPGPSPALARLLALAGAAACGDADLVAREADAAVREGVPPSRLEEALLQIVPYAGFPRALAAFAAARPALGPTAADVSEAPRETHASVGAAAFEAVYGDTADRVRHGLSSLHPLLPAWTVEEAYGRVLSRPALDLREREMLAVSILTAMGGCEDALLGHMRAAVRLGASREDVTAAVAAAPPSAGEGRHDAAVALLDRLAP